VKRVVANFALAIALSGAQAALLRHLGGGRVPLALPLILAVWSGLEGGWIDGTLGAVAVGWVVDVFAGGPQGLLTFLTVVLYLTCRLARAALAVHDRIGFAALTGVGVALYGFTAFAFLRIFAAPEAIPSAAVLWRVAQEAACTGALAGLLHPLLVKLERLLAGEPEPELLGGMR
jgi:hypothetical protein